MKQIFLLIGLVLSLSCSKTTHTGSVPTPPPSDAAIDLSPTLESRILGGEQHYAVYLPPSYTKEPQRRYPVLYLLHGMYQDYKSWFSDGGLQAAADKAIAEGAAEMIIICPNGFNSFYYNSSDMRYEDFFIQEFVPEIERRYRILSEKEHRNIAGLSMGGFGATYL
ncbi:MAG: alpha/beta hydrolase, partial [Capnocytophaga granulosa]